MAQGLGRGLNSLIPKKTIPTGDSFLHAAEMVVLQDGDRILRISPDRITINPHQPRSHFNEHALNDLAESIREHGIIQPLIVTKHGESFELIAGERRLRSARLIGLSEVPVIVRREDEQKKLELALIENLQRENLNPLETARAYRRLIDEFNITQEEAAKRVGKARSSVANSLRLLQLPLPIQEALRTGQITEAHAKYLLGLEDSDKQLAVLKKIVRQNWTVAQTDQEIRKMSNANNPKGKDFFDRAQEDELAQLFSTKVELKRRGKGGQLVVHFYSEEELAEIIKKIKDK